MNTESNKGSLKQPLTSKPSGQVGKLQEAKSY